MEWRRHDKHYTKLQQSLGIIAVLNLGLTRVPLSDTKKVIIEEVDVYTKKWTKHDFAVLEVEPGKFATGHFRHFYGKVCRTSRNTRWETEWYPGSVGWGHIRS